MILAKQGPPDRWYQCGFSRAASCLLCFSLFLHFLLLLGVCVCGGEDGCCGLCFPVVDFCASARDVPREEGMILGL